MSLALSARNQPVSLGRVGVGPASVGPVISQVQVASVTGTTATISWLTDQNATDQVEYGQTIAYGSLTPMGTAPATAHAVVLTGLVVNTTYHFRVWSTAAGLQSVSVDYTFTTAPTLFGAGAVNPDATAPPLPLYLQPGQDETAIRARISARVAGQVDLAEGSFELDWIRLASMEFALLPPALWRVLNSTFMQNPECAGVLADLRAGEEGVDRNTASWATAAVTFTALAGTVIPSGTRVATGTSATGVPVAFETTVAVTVPVGATSVVVTCVAQVAGPSGNVPANSITIPVDSVAGVTAVANLAPSSGGGSAESDAALKNRYFIAVRNRGTSGNKAQWRNWALSVSGVGNVAVVRTPAGAGSVGLSLLGTDGNPASDAVVNAVKQLLIPDDPNAQGLAPIGPSQISIYKAPVIQVNVSANVTYGSGVDVPTTRTNIAVRIGTYLAGLAFNAADNSVHPDQIGVVISQTPGVLYYDLASLRVNNGTSTVAVPPDTIAMLGQVTV